MNVVKKKECFRLEKKVHVNAVVSKCDVLLKDKISVGKAASS